MTPAITLLKKQNIVFQIHRYSHDPNYHSYGEEAAKKLGIPRDRVFKTLIVNTDNGSLITVVLPVQHQLNMKQLCREAKAKKAVMAEKKLVENTTGYVLGGVSPLGQKKILPTFVCQSAKDFETIFVSAGKRGLEIEISPQQLVDLTQGKYARLF